MRLNLPLVLRSWLLLFSSRRLLSFWQFANNILMGFYLILQGTRKYFLPSLIYSAYSLRHVFVTWGSNVSTGWTAPRPIDISNPCSREQSTTNSSSLLRMISFGWQDDSSGVGSL